MNSSHRKNHLLIFLLLLLTDYISGCAYAFQLSYLLTFPLHLAGFVVGRELVWQLRLIFFVFRILWLPARRRALMLQNQIVKLNDSSEAVSCVA